MPSSYRSPSQSIQTQKTDWLTLLLYFSIMIFGWINIYAASSSAGSTTILDFNYPYGKQFVWILISLIIGGIVYLFDTYFLQRISLLAYLIGLLLLGLTLFIGKEVNGAKAWIELGPFRLQASELAKVSTTMFLASYLSSYHFSIQRWRDRLLALFIFLFPAILIVLQKDMGTALVYGAFIFVLFREGLPPIYLIIALIMGINAGLVIGLHIAFENPAAQYFVLGIEWVIILFLVIRWISPFIAIPIGLLLSLWTLSVHYIVFHLLKPHQQARIITLFKPEVDPSGTGWNILQSKIAIGSGGLWGKGFLQGTQTKFDFVPQQHTDFIFCTIGEEYGWVGSTLFLLAYAILIWRILFLSENCRSRYGRILGYCLASLLFVHFIINIGMTIGFVPVIGIPLPFVSYGGSSLIAFTILLAIVLKFYAKRLEVIYEK